MEFTVKQIAHIIGGQVVGNENLKINQLTKIDEGNDGGISFLSNLKYEPFLYSTKASAVIVNHDFEPKKDISATLIKVQDAYNAFTTLLEEYQKILNYSKNGIEQPSFISSTSSLDEGHFVGAFAYIGEHSKIGKNVKIYPQVHIGDNVCIGDNTIIYAGVKIYKNTVIGNNCVIHAGAVIGSDGFGFAPQPDGTYKAIPQLGNVIIEDNVSIGGNSTVDCATMGSTIIREGVKLDNLVQIAHNVEIGKNTVIAAQTGVAGSTKIGENCMIGGQVGFAGHLTIANHTKIAAQSGVSKSVKKEGMTLMGTFAFDAAEQLKSQASFKRLPHIEKQIKELETKIAELINESIYAEI